MKILDDLHLEDLRNELHPSFFDENEGYDMLIVRVPVMVQTTVQAESLGFIVMPDRAYYYDKAKQTFERLPERFEAMHAMIDRATDKTLRLFYDLQERVVDMEEQLYDNQEVADFMHAWLAYKRDILRIERILLKSAQTLGEVIRRYESLDAFPVNHYVDTHEHMERMVRSAALSLSKLDYLYSFHNARTNDKMNRMIYILTIISSIFLPLNLLVGFFGMNTSGLPFTESASGTFYAATLMTGIIAALSWIVYLFRGKLLK